MKPILFVDFDGTLCHDRFWRSLPADVYRKVQQYLFIQNKHLVREWMVGIHTSEDVNRLLAAIIDEPYELLWSTFVQDCKTMTVSEDELRQINMLRNKYVTVLMTGNMDSFNRFTVPALKLEDYFDEIHNSYDDRRLKDDDKGASFVDAIERYMSNIEQSYLIDDSPRACATFTAIGGTGLLVRGSENLSHHLASLV